MSPEFAVQEKQLSIVLIGGFHPLNFSNDWLKLHELVSQGDYDKSRTNILSPAHLETIFPWVTIKITPYDEQKSRLSIILSDPAMYDQFKDLVGSICDMYSTTQVTALGINFSFVTKHANQEEWDSFGYSLLSPDRFVKHFEPEPKDDQKPGMNSASMKIDSVLPSMVDLSKTEYKTELNVTIKPLYHNDSGERIYFSSEIILNYHFPILKENSMDGVVKTIDKYMDDLEHSVQEQLISFVKG